MNPPGDTKRNGQKLNGLFGLLFPNKPGGIAHFADLVNEMVDVTVVIDEDIDPNEFVRQCRDQAQCGLDRSQVSIPQRSDKQRTPHDFLKDRKRFVHIKNCCARTRPFTSNKTEQVTAMETDQDDQAKSNALSTTKSRQYAGKKAFPLNVQNCCARTRPFASNKTEQVTAMETDQDDILAKLNAEKKEFPFDEQVDKSQRRPRRKVDKNSFVNSEKTHIRTDTDEKPYKCDQCSYAGKSKAYLKQHMLTHTGEKSYKCDMCSYAGAHKRALQMHIRIHTREKPYNCDHCSYASAHPSSFKRHVRTHLQSCTGEKSNKCDQCQFVSAKRNGVKIHKRIHKKAITPNKGNEQIFETPKRSFRKEEESVHMDREEAEEYVPEIDLSFTLEEQNIIWSAVESHHQSEYWKEMCNEVAARSEK